MLCLPHPEQRPVVANSPPDIEPGLQLNGQPPSDPKCEPVNICKLSSHEAEGHPHPAIRKPIAHPKRRAHIRLVCIVGKKEHRTAFACPFKVCIVGSEAWRPNNRTRRTLQSPEESHLLASVELEGRPQVGLENMPPFPRHGPRRTPHRRCSHIQSALVTLLISGRCADAPVRLLDVALDRGVTPYSEANAPGIGFHFRSAQFHSGCCGYTLHESRLYRCAQCPLRRTFRLLLRDSRANKRE